MIDLSIPVEGNIISWHWNYDNGNYSNLVSPNYTYSDSGLYNVSLYVINNYGCTSDTATHPFYVYAYPLISAGPDMNILEDVGALLQSTAIGTNLTYTWTSGLYLNNTHILNPYCTPSNDINYLLTVTGIGGCASKDEVKIFALRKLLIPNTFSPNKDGINDYWEISNLNLYPDANVRIFTRTGQKVFESNGYRKPWDGTKSGNILPIDTYYYIIEPGSGRPPVKGYVTIIK
jgi:gliding motility-associated-like protein